MSIKANDRIVILGAGPTGLSIGQRLGHHGKSATLIESQPRCGGLSQTFEVRGCRVDLGPHLLHTSDQTIIDMLTGLLGKDLVETSVTLEVFIEGRFVRYPIKDSRVISVLNFPTACKAVVDLLWARMHLLFDEKKIGISFQDVLIREYGTTLFNIYFGPYAEKVWKMSATELSSSVALRRVPTLSIRDYLRRWLKVKPKKFHKEDPDSVRVFYPRLGIGQLMEIIEQKVRDTHSTIETNSKLEEVKHDGLSVTEVVYDRQGEKKTKKVDLLFSTIPLPHLIKSLRPAPPVKVLRAANELDYCHSRLLYVVVKKERVFRGTLTYFQGRSEKFNRVYSVRSLSPSCVPEGHEILCVEFTCLYGDEIWESKDNELADYVTSVFEKLGLLKREEVAFYFCKNAEFAYPRFKVGYEERVATIYDYLQKFSNLITLGRQGLFYYGNIDDMIRMSFQVVDRVCMEDSISIDYAGLVKELDRAR